MRADLQHRCAALADPIRCCMVPFINLTLDAAPDFVQRLEVLVVLPNSKHGVLRAARACTCLRARTQGRQCSSSIENCTHIPIYTYTCLVRCPHQCTQLVTGIKCMMISACNVIEIGTKRVRTQVYTQHRCLRITHNPRCYAGSEPRAVAGWAPMCRSQEVGVHMHMHACEGQGRPTCPASLKLKATRRCGPASPSGGAAAPAGGGTTR